MAIDRNLPTFSIFPVNNNRTAWRPFGLPVILVVPNRKDPAGTSIENSEIYNVRIYIEDVPRSAFVAGHQNVGIRYPDKDLYSKSLSSLDLADRKINLSLAYIYKIVDGDEIAVTLSEAITGDIVRYTTTSGITSTIEYIVGAEYYDLSDILIDVELLPSDNYNLVYEGEYFTRIVSEDSYQQLLCINKDTSGVALTKFTIQHPGAVIENMYRLTPPPYLSDTSKALDKTIEFYRPFADILQDIMDEQVLLERVNWVFDVQPETVPYLSSLLGWDIPYFPKSLDQLRRAVLRRTVELQNLKGSRRSIISIFKLFGFDILISNLWYSADGQRYIRPGESLPPQYNDEEIQLIDTFQIDLVLDGYSNAEGFPTYKAMLLQRPQSKAGIDEFVSYADNGIITIDAYSVEYMDPEYYPESAYKYFSDIAIAIKSDPTAYGDEAGCKLYTSGSTTFIEPLNITDGLNNRSIKGFSRINIVGEAISELSSRGVHPPLTTNGVSFDRERNELALTLNGYYDTQDNERIFIFASYQKIDTVIPAALKDLQSNRFDLQVLLQSELEAADPTTLGFAIEFLNRLKAFHSLLHVIRTRIELVETYEVTDLLVGGDYTQRYNTDIGRLQVPPAILPCTPGVDCSNTGCDNLPPSDLGYKPEDLVLRERKLANLIEEFDAWLALDGRDPTPSEGSRLGSPLAKTQSSATYNYLGQDRLKVYDNSGNLLKRIETVRVETTPNPNANSLTAGFKKSDKLSPIEDVLDGQFLTNGPSVSSNNDSSLFGSFTVEYTQTRETLTDLNVGVDFKYKGRVDDELLYRPTLKLQESYFIKPCNLAMGMGVYWTYPTISVISTPGTKSPASGSKTGQILFSGNSPSSSVRYYDTDIQNGYLNVSYSSKLPSKYNSYLGRLYRDYRPDGETLHFSNRRTIDSIDQKSHLALIRHSLEVQKPTLHLPGCRFPMMYALLNDLISSTIKARPYDDLHSTYCGISNNCFKAPSFLNFEMGVDTNGDEYLIFDDEPYTVIGNGLSPDISSLGSHDDSLVDYEDVIHKVYMKDANANPAITFDQVCDYNSLVDAQGLTYSSKKIFNSAAECEPDVLTAGSVGALSIGQDNDAFYGYGDSTDNMSYIDYADGYPCESGVRIQDGINLFMSDSTEDDYTDIWLGLGLESSVTRGTYTFAYTLGSGIRTDLGQRLDCGCSLAPCDNATSPIEALCTKDLFLDQDGEYDWDPDHIIVDRYLKQVEEYGACGILLDGTISAMLMLSE